MTETQLERAPTLAEQVRAAARKLDTIKQPSAAARDAFTALVEQGPGLWRIAGDLARGAEDNILETMNTNAATRASVKVGIAEMRQELRRDDDPRLIKLLVEQVLVCWLQMYQAQYTYATVLHDTYTLAKADYWERRLTATQGRYLRALETLARVRRLAIPVQVNIATNGGQQVNQVNTTTP